ncbi:MAG TPA: helix-turn-helix transcriptional regulator [Candidatus Limivivens intestinipullorum]|uniref:Helix-turn-helix transcriptional regulator n=1 Tax=Candidatus Limivivens intestinipullorum TaxID=2840858 RepID=A0A9D1EQP8_9FIRM|nr:helix-turn-helix transcriptional regulator [Candidatus Limivivens intestinipullorum]
MRPFLEEIRHGTPAYAFQIYHMDLPEKASAVNYHWHRELEILRIEEGSLTVTDNQTARRGTAGDLFFIMPEHIHTMRTGSAPVRYDAFLFPLSFLDFASYDDVQDQFLSPLQQKKLLFPSHLADVKTRYPKIWALFGEVLSENTARSHGYQLATKICLLKLFCLLHREGLLVSTGDGQDAANPRQIQTLREILMYINANYQRTLTLAEAADRFHLSPKYFSRYFHQSFGRTFTEYVNDCRILRSCELLKTTDASVLTIALSVGFENVSYFIRRFKDTTGYTPGEYRKTAKGENSHPSKLPRTFL